MFLGDRGLVSTLRRPVGVRGAWAGTVVCSLGILALSLSACRLQTPSSEGKKSSPVLEQGLSAGPVAAGSPNAAAADPKGGGSAKDVAAPAAQPQVNAADAKSDKVDKPPTPKKPPKQAPKSGVGKPRTQKDSGSKRAGPADSSALAGTRKVLLLGDSLAATGFGVLLEKALDAHPNIDCARRAKSATGLARPDFFDWYKHSKRAVAKHDPELVIVILGGNDGQDLVLEGKQRARWKKEEWDNAYAARVLEFVDGMKAPGRKMVWLGLPRTDTKNFEKKLKRIRAVIQEALGERSSWVNYVDTTPMVVDERGTLKKNVRRGRRVAPLRQKDGIHFTMHGSGYFADQVYPVIVNALGLDDVQAQ